LTSSLHDVPERPNEQSEEKCVTRTHDRINVNGGAIVLGHPLGATGVILLGTAVDELERANKSTVLVTLCIGGGTGIATIIERV
jgi:acetyl-CoA C-acetyltransferase